MRIQAGFSYMDNFTPTIYDYSGYLELYLRWQWPFNYTVS